MFDRFGEMTCQEINELAENLFNENDIDSLRALAKENGIGKAFVDAYIEGEYPQLCDPLTAALGKLEIEKAAMKPTHLMRDWVSYIETQCLNDEMLAIAVRNKGKTLKGCMGELLKYSFSNRIKVDQEIVKAAGINNARVEFGVPGMGEAKKIICEYYLGGRR